MFKRKWKVRYNLRYRKKYVTVRQRSLKVLHNQGKRLHIPVIEIQTATLQSNNNCSLYHHSLQKFRHFRVVEKNVSDSYSPVVKATHCNFLKSKCKILRLNAFLYWHRSIFFFFKLRLLWWVAKISSSSKVKTKVSHDPVPGGYFLWLADV